MADQLPARREIVAVTRPAAPAPSYTDVEHGLRISDIWGLLRRNWLIIVGITVVAVAAAVTYATKATPIYEATTTIRVDEKEQNLPGIFRSMSSAAAVRTELEVLKSRSLIEDAIAELGLRLVVTAPDGIPRSRLLQHVKVAAGAPVGKYTLENLGDGTFALRRRTEAGPTSLVAGDGSPDSVGLSFTPTAEAARYTAIELEVQHLEETTRAVRSNVGISVPSRDVQIAVVAYRDTDPQLVWQVPNTIARRFIERRQETYTGEARSTVAFLRSQLDTLATQLESSENALRDFREREHVVDPGTEASTRVTRLVELQAQRSTVDGERAALAALLAEVQNSATDARPDQPSPYRRLLAFPTLIGHQSASDRLAALAALEDQRATLLARRTPKDPDVQVLTTRIEGIEEQLRLTVVTYLQGLTNQVASLDATLRRYSGELEAVPQRQLAFARLQRQPKVLEEMYALLQTRLKEAEIAQAVQDVSVSVVDPAIEPLEPVAPKRSVIVAAGLLGGLILGVGLALFRELLDRSIHTRADVQVATGLPVLGLIPRIPLRGKYAVIAQNLSKGRIRPATTPPPPPGPAHPDPIRTRYTFLGDPEPEVAAPNGSRDHGSVPAEVLDLGVRMTIPGTGTAVTEAYGTLQTNLLYSRDEIPLRTVVFTSPLPGEGKTTNATNLALTLAQRGVSVVVVDADVRRGVIHQLFAAKQEPGLSDVLGGRVPVSDALRAVRVEDGGTLHFLTKGRMTRNPVALLESSAMKKLIAELQEMFEVVIMDAPPVNILTDAAVLGAHSDGVVLVVRAGETQSGALEFAMQQLQLVRARVLGVVLNDVDFKRDAAYDATYKYYQYDSGSKE